MVYDYEGKTSKILFNFPRDLNLRSQLFFVGEDKIVFLAGKIEMEYEDSKEKVIYENSELILYDLKTNKFEWLTNDNLDKDALDVICRNTQ